MARQLVEAGVTMVQVNLGNNEAWDTHGDLVNRMRANARDVDQASAALVADLKERGLLDEYQAEQDATRHGPGTQPLLKGET